MMTKEEILSRIKRVLVSSFELDPADVTLEAHLFEELDLDSLDAIDLAVTLKTETGIRLKEEEIKGLRTVGDVVNVIHTNLSNANSLGN